MIGKVSTPPSIGLPHTPASPSPLSHEHSGFRSVLNDKLNNSGPLELLFIEFLKRTIESLFSSNTSEEDGLFFTPPFVLEQTMSLRQKSGQTFLRALEQKADQETSPAGHPSSAGGSLSPDVPGPLRESLASGGEPADPGPLQTAVPWSGFFPDQGTNPDHEEMVEEASKKYGVDPALIKAVIAVESGGNPNALSPAGAQGLMQLMPRTAAELGVTNPYNPAENIMAGTRYLRQLLDRYAGNVRLALAAYNWGMGNLEKRPEAMPRETRNYISKVESLYRTSLASSI
jgi:hypothetical protein